MDTFPKNTFQESKEVQNKLITNYLKRNKSRVYIDTIISPSYTSALAQVIQLSGISGKGNNLILFEYKDTQTKELQKIIENFQLLKATEFDVCILRKSFRSFGSKKSGNFIPGHGGMLDRMDAFTITIPVIYILTNLL